MRLTVLADEWPALSETFIRNEVAALARAGHHVHVEAGAHAAQPDPHPEAASDVAVAVGQGDPPLRRLIDLAWLASRHSLRCLADLRARDRWRPAEEPRPLRELAPAARRARAHRTEHLHAHFAAGAALDALRLGALLGLPVSITAHANDIFAHPRNLAEKLAAARFTTSGCRYTVDALRDIAGPPHADRVHEVIMGVDTEEFARRTPHPSQRTVVAVGRLVAKKGFEDLLEAVALLRDRGVAPQRTIVVGEGPLRERLVELVAELDLASLVELAGPLDRAGVRDRLEQAAVLAMPCVLGPDGDRDSMPVVVKGRAGRAFVSEHCHVDREAARLVGLITYRDAPARRGPCAAGSSRRSTATSLPRKGSRS